MKSFKELRESAGISQRQLAEASGISLGSIRSYEQGRRDLGKVNLETALELCRLLNCTVQDLISLKQTGPKRAILIKEIYGLNGKKSIHLYPKKPGYYTVKNRRL